MDVPRRSEAEPAGPAGPAEAAPPAGSGEISGSGESGGNPPRPVDGLRAVHRRLRRAGGWGKGRARAAAARARILRRQDHFRRLSTARAMRRAYQRAVAADGFSSDRPKVAFCVSTRDLRAGRADLYAAIGLGRQLSQHGYEVAYFPPERWATLPPDTGIAVALGPAFDPTVAPDGTRLVAWVRDEAERWAAHERLALFDAVFAGSPTALSRLAERYDGPTGLLPLGVDTDLFQPPRRARRAGVATAPGTGEVPRHLYQALRRGQISYPFAIPRRGDALDRIFAPYGIGTPGYFKLPDLYGRSLLVLDDISPTLRADGLASPALLESLAAGALPVTNSRLPLVELGLDDVPTGGEEKTFGGQLAELLAEPGRIEERARELGARVRETHSYARRAEELHLLLNNLARIPRRTTRPLLGVYPVDGADPYRSALLSGLAADGVASYPVADVVADPAPHSRDRLDNYALHLLDTGRILAAAGSAEEAAARFERLTERIGALRDRGGKLIVTVGDVRAREWSYPELERRLGEFLAGRADVIHVASTETAARVAPHYRLVPEKIRVIAHGSYLGRLPQAAGRALARDRFGLGAEEIAFLVFSGLGAHRGLESLLDAFALASERDGRLRLIVAGPPSPSADADRLVARCAADPRIITVPAVVPDGEIQLYYKAADAVVLPAGPVRDSRAFQFAITFGRPVVGPREEQELDPEYAIGFEPGDADSLRDALLAATELRGRAVERAARRAAEAYRAEDMARDYAALVRKLLD